MWQDRAGGRRRPTVIPAAGNHVKQHSRRQDSEWATIPSPSKVVRQVPSPADSQVFPRSQGKNAGSPSLFAVTMVRVHDIRPGACGPELAA